jgi:hypothetical protein
MAFRGAATISSHPLPVNDVGDRQKARNSG